MTIPNIRDVTGRPAVELAGTTADSPIPTSLAIDDLLAVRQYSMQPSSAFPATLSMDGFAVSTQDGTAVTFTPNDNGTLRMTVANRYNWTDSGSGIAGVTTFPVFFASDPSGFGNFRLLIRATHDASGVTDGRFFAGLCGESDLLCTHGDPGSSTIAKIGVGIDAADGSYSLIFNEAGAAPTKIALATARATGGPVGFNIVLSSQLGVVGIAYQVSDIATGAVLATGLATTNIPSSVTSPDDPLGNSLAVDIDCAVASGYAGQVGLFRVVAIVDDTYGKIGLSSVTPPPPSSDWHEDWDEADYSALIAKYTASGFQFFADPIAFPAAASVFVVTGGKLEMRADGGSWGAEFGPADLTTPALEYWMRVQLEMVGGAFDTADNPFKCYVDDATFTLEADLDTANVLGVDVYGTQALPSGSRSNTAFDRLFAAGTHTFILCASEDDSTHQRVELWIDASPGDPPSATSIATKTAGMGFSHIDFFLTAPTTSGLVLKVLPIAFESGNRATDPFGIL